MSAIVLTALLFASAVPVWGQTAPEPQLRGRIEQLTDTDIVLRTQDGRLHVVDTAAISRADLSVLEPGDDVAITTKSQGTRGPIGRSVQRLSPPPPRH